MTMAMESLITAASPHLDDPLILEWATRRYADTPRRDGAARSRMESEWFHDLTLARALEGPDRLTAGQLLRELPPGRFAHLREVLTRVWRDGSPSLARGAAVVLARTAPEALLELYETALGRIEQGAPLEAERFGAMTELAEAADSAHFGEVLERLARMLSQTTQAAYDRSLLAGHLLALAGRLDAERLSDLLEVSLGGDSRDFVQERILGSLFKGLFGRADYLDLVFALGEGYSGQRLSSLGALFEPQAPLMQFDEWLVEAPESWPDPEPMLAEQGRRHPGCATLHGLLEPGGVLARRLPAPLRRRIALAGCIQGLALPVLDTTGLDLATTLDLLAADLDPHPWRDALRLKLADFDREAIAARLLARLPECLNTYGGQTLIWAMGELGRVEFIPALIDSIAGESVDFINEVARNALTELGAPAQASVISRWDAFDRTRKIYGLSVIQAVAGEPAAEFALNRFDELMALEPEFCLDLTLAHPDPRLLRRLEPELRRRQDLIDRAYYIGARLLGVAGPEVEAAGERARIAEEKTRQRLAALGPDLSLPDLEDGPLSLELRCPACGDVNWYEVAGVIHPGQYAGEELPCLVADEFPCVSCGEYVEFEFTPRATMGVMARMLGVQTGAGAKDEDESAPTRVGYMTMSLEGKTVPAALALRRLRERLAAHPGDLSARALLGMTLAGINRPQAANEHLGAVLDAQPKALDVALFLARELDANGETLEAFDRLRHAVKAPGDWVRLSRTGASTQEFVRFYNALRQELRRIDLPALHPSALEPPVKVGRNDPCPCGSGKKYKKCCMQ